MLMKAAAAAALVRQLSPLFHSSPFIHVLSFSHSRFTFSLSVSQHGRTLFAVHKVKQHLPNTHTVASVRVSRRLKTTRHILISSSSSSALQLPCSLYYYLVTILHTSNSLSPEGYHSRMLMTADGACACVCQRGTLRFLSFAVVCRFCTRPVSSISASQTPCVQQQSALSSVHHFQLCLIMQVQSAV